MSCRFGRFELDRHEHRLRADGEPIALGTRAFGLLCLLVERAGSLVAKREILERVWEGLVVEENNLQVQVSTLRKVLGAGAIATIPGRGYRFELAVTRDGEEKAAPQDSASAAVAAPRRTNLPERLQPLFGRDGDIAEVRELLQRHALVTITGSGGIGKTRLAQAVAYAIAHDADAPFADGVWWVDLASLADETLVVSAAARALGVSLASDRRDADALAAALGRQQLLVVLDNGEHVAHAVATLAQALVTQVPGASVIVTSQEVLRTGPEQVYRLSALPVPAGGSPDEVRCAAVDLFVERVRAVAPHFVLTDEHGLHAVAEICRRLDGIPLAIELAAARVPLLGLDGVRARLDERFSLLAGGARIALRRHQTLRATLEWSHGLLDPDEQAVFRRLGVFSGGFTLEAAQQVASDPHIDAWSAIEHLGALVDKSLVLAEGEAAPRYRLLESTRAYALERLGESGETAAILRRHAEAMLRFTLVLDAQRLRWSPTPARMREVGAELDNLRAAMEWCAATPAGRDLVAPLAGASHRVWYSTGLLREGFDRCLAVRDVVARTASDADAARYWLTVAQLGQYTTRREAYDAALKAAAALRKLGEHDLLHEALASASQLGLRFGSVEEMRAQIDEAAALQHEGMGPRQLEGLEFSRYMYYARLGEFEHALAAARRQVELRADLPLARYLATTQVVSALLELGRLDDAVAAGRDALDGLRALGLDGMAGQLHVSLACALLLLSRVDEAAVYLERAHAHLLREGDEQRVVMPLASLCAMRGRLEDAARLLGYEDRHGDGVRLGGRHHVFALYTRLEQALEALAPDERARLRAQGAAMGAREAFAIGFADS